MKKQESIELGDRVKHKITGFKGVVVAVTQWLNGCVRLNVQPEKLKKEGGQADVETVDIGELELLAKRVIEAPLPAPAFVAGTHPGGPRPTARQPAGAKGLPSTKR